jgi:hypothetical protein
MTGESRKGWSEGEEGGRRIVLLEALTHGNHKTIDGLTRSEINGVVAFPWFPVKLFNFA